MAGSKWTYHQHINPLGFAQHSHSRHCVCPEGPTNGDPSMDEERGGCFPCPSSPFPIDRGLPVLLPQYVPLNTRVSLPNSLYCLPVTGHTCCSHLASHHSLSPFRPFHGILNTFWFLFSFRFSVCTLERKNTTSCVSAFYFCLLCFAVPVLCIFRRFFSIAFSKNFIHLLLTCFLFFRMACEVMTMFFPAAFSSPVCWTVEFEVSSTSNVIDVECFWLFFPLLGKFGSGSAAQSIYT